MLFYKSLGSVAISGLTLMVGNQKQQLVCIKSFHSNIQQNDLKHTTQLMATASMNKNLLPSMDNVFKMFISGL